MILASTVLAAAMTGLPALATARQITAQTPDSSLSADLFSDTLGSG